MANEGNCQTLVKYIESLEDKLQEALKNKVELNNIQCLSQVDVIKQKGGAGNTPTTTRNTETMICSKEERSNKETYEFINVLHNWLEQTQTMDVKVKVAIMAKTLTLSKLSHVTPQATNAKSRAEQVKGIYGTFVNNWVVQQQDQGVTRLITLEGAPSGTMSYDVGKHVNEWLHTVEEAYKSFSESFLPPSYDDWKDEHVNIDNNMRLLMNSYGLFDKTKIQTLIKTIIAALLGISSAGPLIKALESFNQINTTMKIQVQQHIKQASTKSALANSKTLTIVCTHIEDEDTYSFVFHYTLEESKLTLDAYYAKDKPYTIPVTSQSDFNRFRKTIDHFFWSGDEDQIGNRAIEYHTKDVLAIAKGILKINMTKDDNDKIQSAQYEYIFPSQNGGARMPSRVRSHFNIPKRLTGHAAKEYIKTHHTKADLASFLGKSATTSLSKAKLVDLIVVNNRKKS
jgi:hypothetical protein